MLCSSYQNRHLRVRFLLALLPSFPITVPLVVTINSPDTPVGAGFLSTIIIAQLARFVVTVFAPPPRR